MSESYRLASLLELRELEQKSAFRDLQQAKEAAARAQQCAFEARERVQAFIAETEYAMKSATSAESFRADLAASASPYRKARGLTLYEHERVLTEREDALRDAELDVERCEQRVRDSYRALESVRKHRALWLDRRALATARAEDNAMDERLPPGASKSSK